MAKKTIVLGLVGVLGLAALATTASADEGRDDSQPQAEQSVAPPYAPPSAQEVGGHWGWSEGRYMWIANGSPSYSREQMGRYSEAKRIEAERIAKAERIEAERVRMMQERRAEEARRAEARRTAEARRERGHREDRIHTAPDGTRVRTF